jgi:preprotein translocase subunit SecD
MDRGGSGGPDVASSEESSSREAIAQSVAIMARRLNEMAAKNGEVRPEGRDRIVIDFPGAADQERLKSLAGTIGRAGKLEFRLVDGVEAYPPERVPSGSEVLEEKRDGHAYKVVVKKRALLTGVDLADAQAAFDPQTGQPVVNFKFTNAGARKFGRATTENVGRMFAIVLDNEVISAPVIQEPITGGSGRISGNFTVESANTMAILLRAGELPATFRLVDIREVPPRQ